MSKSKLLLAGLAILSAACSNGAPTAPSEVKATIQGEVGNVSAQLVPCEFTSSITPWDNNPNWVQLKGRHSYRNSNVFTYVRINQTSLWTDVGPQPFIYVAAYSHGQGAVWALMEVRSQLTGSVLCSDTILVSLS